MKKTQKPIKFIPYPRIPYLERSMEILSQKVYVFEKIDGALSQVRIINRNLAGGSKSNFLAGRVARVSWFPVFLSWMRSNESLYELRDDVVMFGEWLEPITIEYSQKNLHKFYFLDLAYIEDDKPKFYDYQEALDYLKAWGIKGVQILQPLAKGLFSHNIIKEIMKEPSRLRTGKMEGVVLKNYETGQFAKSIDEEYSEIREEAKTLGDRHITPIRVKKAIRRLRDEHLISKPTLEDVVSELERDLKGEQVKIRKKAIMSVLRARGMFRKP